MIAYHTELQIEMTKRRSRTHNTAAKTMRFTAVR